MNQSTTLAVVGGDVRQAYLAELLHEAGHTVRTFALERRPAAGCMAVSDLQACLDDARAVILPMPVQMGDGSLNAPLANAQHTIGDVLDAIPAGTLTLAGAVPFSVHARAVQNGLILIDYLSREELAIRNAVPAAFAKSTGYPVTGGRLPAGDTPREPHRIRGCSAAPYPVHALHRNTWQARLYHTYPMHADRLLAHTQLTQDLGQPLLHRVSPTGTGDRQLDALIQCIRADWLTQQHVNVQ